MQRDLVGYGHATRVFILSREMSRKTHAPRVRSIGRRSKAVGSTARPMAILAKSSAGSGADHHATRGSEGLAAGAGADGATPKFHVFLLLGQSNMAGYAKAEAADKVEEARVRVLGFDDCTENGRKTDEWDTAAPPLHECWNGAVGPGAHFAKTLLGTLPSEDTIVSCPARSRWRIEAFLKGAVRATSD